MAHAELVLDLLKQRHGILLKRTFYDTWYQSQSLNTSTPEQLYQSILTHFLNTDIASSSQPSIQRNFLGQRTITLQLQDTLDTSHSLSSLVDALDKNGPIARGSLKWILTDGAQDIVVYELNKNTTFGLKTPFGSKIQITSGQYVNGVLLVKPEHIKLLGGQVKALYGDTMENELLRRYTQRLKDQGKATGSWPPVPGSTSIPAHQNRASSAMSTPTAGRMTSDNTNNTNNSTSNSNRSNIPLIANIPTLAPRSDENNDDEFDSLPIDDLTALDELEQQALGSTSRTPPLPNTPTTTTTTILPPVSYNSNTGNKGIDEPDGHSTASSLGKRRPVLSLSTKSPKKRSIETQSVPPLETTSHHATPSRSSRDIINLDDSPPPSPATIPPPQRPNSQHRMSDLEFDDYSNLDDDYSFGDSITLHASPSPPPPYTSPSPPPPPKILTVPELRKLLRSVDDNSFSGTYDKVSVKVQGCTLKTMKPTVNKGLYLVAELRDVYSNETPIKVSFIYYGIDSLYEGYSIKDMRQMKKGPDGISAVREKVFKPLVKRFLTIEAELEIDLLVIERNESGLVRKGIQFTPMSSAG